MKGIVVLKRLMVEWVVVKGATEDLYGEDGSKIDIWGESRYKVFRKVTENANAAMLHFYSPAYPELAIRSFLVSTFMMIFIKLSLYSAIVFTDLVQQLSDTFHYALQKVRSPFAQPFAPYVEGSQKS